MGGHINCAPDSHNTVEVFSHAPGLHFLEERERDWVRNSGQEEG